MTIPFQVHPGVTLPWRWEKSARRQSRRFTLLPGTNPPADEEERMNAAFARGIHAEPERVVPALIRCLTDLSVGVQSLAAEGRETSEKLQNLPYPHWSPCSRTQTKKS